MLGGMMVMRRNDEQTVEGRHRMMRRADREVADPQQVEAIVATCKIVSLAYTDAEGITIVPLNFGYTFDTESNHLTLYFHGSPTGRKMDAVKASNNALPVAFEMATDCEVVEGAHAVQLGRGTDAIIPGKRADLVVINPNHQFVVDANALLSRNPISAFDGAKLDGVTSRTIIGGRTVDFDTPGNPENLISRP